MISNEFAQIKQKWSITKRLTARIFNTKTVTNDKRFSSIVRQM